MSIALIATPGRQGVCPSLSQPLPTGDGLLVRLIPTGTIALAAFGALCAAAHRHGNGIIEITARGSVQVRGLSASSAARFAAEIGAAGIAAQEGIPVLCDPLAGLAGDEIFDCTKLAATLRCALAQASLPARPDPKLSVILESGAAPDLARLAADIRLRAELVNGAPMLRVAVGGNERLAVQLGLIALDCAVEAVMRLLAVLVGPGESRRAREIVVTESAAPFHAALAAATPVMPADANGAARPHADPIGLHRLRDGALACGIGLAFGHANASELEEFAEACSRSGARGLRTAHRALLAVGLGEDVVRPFIAAAGQAGLVTKPNDPRRHVIACAGAPLCASAHIAARQLAPTIAAAAGPYLREDETIHISGCAKGCAHPPPAALTIVGGADACALIANGAPRDAPFAAAAVADLPAATARYLGERHRAEEAVHGARHG